MLRETGSQYDIIRDVAWVGLGRIRKVGLYPRPQLGASSEAEIRPSSEAKPWGLGRGTYSFAVKLGFWSSGLSEHLVL